MRSTDAVREVALRQSGIVTRRQAERAGLTPSAIKHALARDDWRRIHVGTFVVHAGPLSDNARRWAALLSVGAGSCLSHATAAAMYGWVPDQPTIEVTVPRCRGCEPRRGVAVHRSDTLEIARFRGFPVATPLRTVIDLVPRMTTAIDMLSIVSKAVQAGVPGVALQERVRRGRMRWRRHLLDALDDMVSGSHSVLEIQFARLLRRHGIPVGERQVPFGGMWVDMVYDDLVDGGVVIELDGRVGHSSVRDRFRDMDRDTQHAVAGRRVLRFGWADVIDRPCAVAERVAQALRLPEQRCSDCAGRAA
jgi:very-short-patch-repair endonuclease